MGLVFLLRGVGCLCWWLDVVVVRLLLTEVWCVLHHDTASVEVLPDLLRLLRLLAGPKRSLTFILLSLRLVFRSPSSPLRALLMSTRAPTSAASPSLSTTISAATRVPTSTATSPPLSSTRTPTSTMPLPPFSASAPTSVSLLIEPLLHPPQRPALVFLLPSVVRGHPSNGTGQEQLVHICARGFLLLHVSPCRTTIRLGLHLPDTP